MSSRPASKGAGTLRDFHEEERLGKTYDAQLLARLWPFLKPHAKFLFGSLAMIFVAAGLSLVRPIVMGRLVATAQDAHAGGLLRYGILLSLLVFAILIGSYFFGLVPGGRL